VTRDEYENRTDRRVKKREEGEERSEPGYDVVENRKQSQVFFILVHLPEGYSVSCSSSCSSGSWDSKEQEHEHE
jgi:hypothetical protein